jgi:endonuclease/exonuclease/phosphatase family metal-dependent hydrolase
MSTHFSSEAPRFVLLSLLAFGCGESELTVATYNAGLAVSFVSYAEERAPQIIADFPADTLDVICMQEVWEQRFWDQLTASVASTHPHTFRRPNEMETGGTTGCEPGELDALEACVVANCPGATPDTLVDCALDMCGPEVEGLPTPCLNCLINNVSLGDLDMIRAACEGEGGGSYAYEGSFGTGILSRYALAETDSLLLESTANRRAVLYARIPETPQGEIHFFCTHLTANLSSVPYTGTAAGWPEEQAAQIAALLAYAADKTGGTGKWILAGDLNNGPALPGITAELPDNYAMWSAGGLRNLFAEQADVSCTFCDDNPLNLGTMGGEGGLIDHILLSADVPNGTGRRFLDGTIDIVDSGGATVTTAYSDHYGLAFTLGE